eukprot:302936-Pelagomonas_calceolata.AAC.1
MVAHTYNYATLVSPQARNDSSLVEKVTTYMTWESFGIFWKKDHPVFILWQACTMVAPFYLSDILSSTITRCKARLRAWSTENDTPDLPGVRKLQRRKKIGTRETKRRLELVKILFGHHSVEVAPVSRGLRGHMARRYGHGGHYSSSLDKHLVRKLSGKLSSKCP